MRFVYRLSAPIPGIENANRGQLAVSAVNGSGLAELTRRCVECLGDPDSLPSGPLGTTSARCRESLSHAIGSLEAAAEGLGDELIAVEIRESLDHLGRIVGAVYTDDILDRVFSRFCIGK